MLVGIGLLRFYESMLSQAIQRKGRKNGFVVHTRNGMRVYVYLVNINNVLCRICGLLHRPYSGAHAA